MAYRGRVLVEMETVLDEMPPTPVENLSEDDILRVQVRVFSMSDFKLSSHS